MARLASRDRVCDLVQHGVPDLLLASPQGMGAADPDHAVSEMAVAKAPLGLDEREGPAREPMLVHQSPSHSSNAVQPLLAVPRAFLSRPAEQAIGDVPARVAPTFVLKYNIRTRSLADPGTIEDVLAVENDVVPFDRADLLGAGLRPGLPW